MKTTGLLVVFTCLVCVGCAVRYDIRLSNGTIITAKGKPRIDETNHVVFFKDAYGHSNSIPEFRVSEIAPHTTMSEEDSPKKFNPVIKK